MYLIFFELCRFRPTGCEPVAAPQQIAARPTTSAAVSPPILAIVASERRVCWDGPRYPHPHRSLHAASGRLLFFAAIPVGLYRAPDVPRRRRHLWPQGQSQAGGAGRPVLGDRRAAADEAPSGAAALPDG